MCKALSAIEKSNPIAAATFFFSLPSEPTTDLNVLHNMTEAHASNILSFCTRSLQRYSAGPNSVQSLTFMTPKTADNH
jgi:splicing suppressor protein 51